MLSYVYTHVYVYMCLSLRADDHDDGPTIHVSFPPYTTIHTHPTNHQQATIRREFADCTVLTIAHRLETILDSDRILVMAQGRLAEFDKPGVLLNRPGSLFAELVRASEQELRGGASSSSSSGNTSGGGASAPGASVVRPAPAAKPPAAAATMPAPA